MKNRASCGLDNAFEEEKYRDIDLQVSQPIGSSEHPANLERGHWHHRLQLGKAVGNIREPLVKSEVGSVASF